ncbi:hypothetical protein COO60DRAFT_881528 [Scenedesmus sp. NREL 46B-D3]|nr:hypothetical protein COO60DRAFT_881528 [Scenedesmus sp. NREL 46B-D3]
MQALSCHTIMAHATSEYELQTSCCMLMEGKGCAWRPPTLSSRAAMHKNTLIWRETGKLAVYGVWGQINCASKSRTIAVCDMTCISNSVPSYHVPIDSEGAATPKLLNSKQFVDNHQVVCTVTPAKQNATHHFSASAARIAPTPSWTLLAAAAAPRSQPIMHGAPTHDNITRATLPPCCWPYACLCKFSQALLYACMTSSNTPHNTPNQ